MLHFIQHGELATEEIPESVDHLIEDWALGDALGVVGFQNAVMLDLLRMADVGDLPSTEPMLETIFELTKVGSPLRRLFIEQLLHDFHKYPEKYKPSDYERIKGVLSEMVVAQQQFMDMGKMYVSRLLPSGDGGSWEDFMV
jgi:hypothetical protein